MHPDLKHFYEKVIDIVKYPDEVMLQHAYSQSYKYMLDTHPNCEELLDSFTELAIAIYEHGDGPVAQALAEEMNEIEQTLDSCRLPF